jgi:hypothetical protein
MFGIGYSLIMLEKDEARFRAKFDRRGTEECWPWTAATNTSGYGVMHSKVERLAHRMAYRVFVGPIPDGLVVRHRCDNPLCVNPKHLVAGTQVQNMRDAIERDRFPHGTDHHSLRLGDDGVKTILRSDEPAEALAARFGVSPDYVRMIQRGARRARVQVEDLPKRTRLRRKHGPYGEGHHTTTLTAEDVLAIRIDPRTNQAIADAYGTSTTTVSNIKNGKTWKRLLTTTVKQSP